MSKIEFRIQDVDTNELNYSQWDKIQDFLRVLVDERYDISIHYIGDGVIGIDWEPAYFPQRNLVWVEGIDNITDGAAAQLSKEEKEKLYGEEWNPKPIHFNEGSLNITTTLPESFDLFAMGWKPTDEFVPLATDKDIDMMIDEFNQPTAAEKGEM